MIRPHKQRNQWISNILSKQVHVAQAVVDEIPENRAMLYRITASGGPGYIGVTNDIVYRLKQHLSSDTYIGRSLKKHSLGLHAVEVLLVGERGYVYEMECRAIAAFGTLSPGGMNMDAGGLGGNSPCEEVRLKHSLATKGRPKPEGFADKLRARRGEKRSPEARERMRQVQLGKRHSEETKRKMSVAKKGKGKSEETRRRMSEAQFRRYNRVK